MVTHSKAGGATRCGRPRVLGTLVVCLGLVLDPQKNLSMRLNCSHLVVAQREHAEWSALAANNFLVIATTQRLTDAQRVRRVRSAERVLLSFLVCAAQSLPYRQAMYACVDVQGLLIRLMRRLVRFRYQVREATVRKVC